MPETNPNLPEEKTASAAKARFYTLPCRFAAQISAFFRAHSSLLLRLLRIAVPAGILLLAVGTLLRYIIGPSEGFYTSDCTDTLLWANASYESGQLISDRFDYAALLPFGGNLLMLPFIPLFGVSMTTQKIGMVLFLLLFAAGVLFFCRSLKQGWIASALTVFVTCFILSSSEKLLEIMWQHVIYYSLGILFFAVGMGLLFRADTAWRENRRRSAYVFSALLFLFTVLSAANGLQAAVTFILPAVFSVGMVWVLDDDRKGVLRETVLSFAFLVGILLAALMGFGLLTLVCHGVSAGYADAYSNYDNLANWTANLQKLPINWLKLLGVTAVAGEPLASAESVVRIIRVLGGLALPILPFFGFLRYRKIGNRYVQMTLFAHLAVSGFILFAYICGQLGSANWRLVPMLGTSVLAGMALLCDMLRDLRFSVRKLGAVLLLIPCLMSAASYLEVARLPYDYGRDNSYHTIADALVERNLTKGYATFWNSQIVTLLSDSKSKVRNIQLETVDGRQKPVIYRYQTSVDWYDDSGEERTFLLLSSGERTALFTWLRENADQIEETISIDSYYVIVFSGAVPIG